MTYFVSKCKKLLAILITSKIQVNLLFTATEGPYHLQKTKKSHKIHYTDDYKQCLHLLVPLIYQIDYYDISFVIHSSYSPRIYIYFEHNYTIHYPQSTYPYQQT